MIHHDLLEMSGSLCATLVASAGCTGSTSPTECWLEWREERIRWSDHWSDDA